MCLQQTTEPKVHGEKPDRTEKRIGVLTTVISTADRNIRYYIKSK